MARRLIGLDIGTNAVRVAEIEPGNPPRLTTFGQVALPPGAMRDGEVVDPAAVTDAIQRLWKELSLKKGPVRIGVASPRVLVRTVDLPTMSDDELAGALQFHAADLIPIPLEDAVLDFQVLEALGTPDAEGADGAPAQPMSRVLLAAAHKDLVGNLVGSVRAAGLSVSGVDLVPLALIRSVGRRVSDNGGGVEAIVSIGGGVTVVVVHELGIPRFVRILGSGGRSITDAISRELDVTPDQAEAIKRQISTAPADLAERATRAIERPVSDLVEQIRGSLDYYRTQPDSIRLLHITVTGGAALTSGLADRLVDTVGVPVDLARPREHIAIGDIGFPDDQLPALDPFLPVPVGLALGGLLSVKRIDLLGTGGKEPADRSQLIKFGAIAAAALLVVLGGLYFLKSKQVDNEKQKAADAQAENSQLQSQINSLSDVQGTQTEIETLAQQTQSLLVTDVSWSSVLERLSRTIPSTAWLSSFQGTVAAAGSAGSTAAPTTPPPTTAPTTSGTTAAGTSVIGTVNFAGNGTSFDAVAAWITDLGDNPDYSGLWVSSAARGGSSSGSSSSSTSSSSTRTSGTVTFASTADLTSNANSKRAEKFKAGS
jgi:type IV pilus assembly protein PilM